MQDSSPSSESFAKAALPSREPPADGPDLWGLVWGKPQIDPDQLAAAVAQAAAWEDLDFRTRVLIHDSLLALESYWGKERVEDWLHQSQERERLQAIREQDLGKPGFPHLRERLMNRTEPETVKQFLRELGTHLETPTRLEIRGAIALILSGQLTRATADIDVADEVPAPIRDQHQLLEQLAQRCGLVLAPFQGHYLPAGWRDRLHSLGPFGKLQVLTADPYDVFLGKLFSARTKDRDDLRLVQPTLDHQTLVERFRTTTAVFLKVPTLRQHAERNWYILFGEALPS